MDGRNFSEIAAAHPMPWRASVVPRPNAQGLTEVQLRDTNGQVVPLFTIVRFTELVTLSIAQRPPATRVEPAPAVDPVVAAAFNTTAAQPS